MIKNKITEYMSNSSLRVKLSLFFVALIAITLALGFWIYRITVETTEYEVKNNLTALLEAKETNLRTYLDSIEDDLLAVGENPFTHDALRDFGQGWEDFGETANYKLQQLYVQNNDFGEGQRDKFYSAGDGSLYSIAHQKYHSWFRSFLKRKGYYDIYLFDAAGNLIYTVFKESDYATNIVSGRWNNTALAEAFNQAINTRRKNSISFVDFTGYEPIDGEAASFIATPLFSEEGITIGVLAFQMPANNINKIMNQSAGLGETGEAYIVGSDFLMRTDSRFEGGTMLRREVRTENVKHALEGESGILPHTFDYRGKEIFSVFRSFQYQGTNWALLADMETGELMRPVERIRGVILMSLASIIVVSALIIMLTTRIITLPVLRMTKMMSEIARGELETEMIEIDRRDEIGEMAEALGMLKKSALEAIRIKSATDNAQTNVLVTDDDYNIVYLNGAICEMFAANEDELKKQMPQLDITKIIGSNLDIFEDVQLFERDLLEALEKSRIEEVRIGNLTFNLSVSPILTMGKRVGTMIEWEDRTEELARAWEEKRVADRNLRIRIALDNASTNVMVTDKNFDIVYVNAALIDMFSSVEEDLTNAIAAFTVKDIIGSNIRLFYGDDEEQHKILDRLTTISGQNLKLGEHDFRLTLSPVKGEDGERLGTVVEWQDQTGELAVKREIEEVVSAAEVGDYTKVISLDGKEGFMLAMSKGINNITSTTREATDDLVQVLSHIAQGNLTERIEGNYSGIFGLLQVSSNTTAEKLTNIVTHVTRTAREVALASTELSGSSDDLSLRTEAQASSLEETAATVEQLSVTVRQNSESAQKASELAAQSRDAAVKGGGVAEEAVEAMSALEASSQKISDIISVIDDLAFQTNLLALNAAVEAARAGEAGKGFAVVAEEVRTLAQRSAQASDEIKGLIMSSNDQVKTGVELVNEAGTALSEIVNSVKQVASIVSEIASASTEQAQGIDEVNGAIARMDDVTQQNASLVQQSTAAARHLEQQSAEMQRLMSFFTIGALDEEGDIDISVAKPLRQRSKALSSGSLLPDVEEEKFNDDADWAQF